MIKTIKRLSVVCLLLAVFLCAAAPVSAADYVTGDQVPIYMDFCILFKLKERDAAGFPWMATKYCYTIENGASLATDGDWLYCIDYYGHAQQGMVNATATALDETAEWNSLSMTAQRGITYALIYGGANYSNEIYGYAATQLIIWEYQLDQRKTPVDRVSFFSATLAQSARLKKAYEEILSAMASHIEAPVFPEIVLRGYGEEYAVAVTDQNAALSKDNWAVVSGGENLVVRQEEDSLHIYALESFLQGGSTELILAKDLSVNCGNAVCVLTGSQRAIIGTPPDPIFASISVRMEQLSDLKLIKYADDGAVGGISFSVEERMEESYRSLGSYTTAADGTLTIPSLIVGKTYRLTEAVPEGYQAEQQVQEITIAAGENTVTFVNYRTTEVLTIIKKLAPGSTGSVSGIQFRIYGQGSKNEVETVSFTIEAPSAKENGKGITIGDLALKSVRLPDNYALPVRVTYNGGALPKSTSFRIIDQYVLFYDSTGTLSPGEYRVSYYISVPAQGDLIATVETEQDGTFGKAVVEQLHPGEMYWIEEVVPEGFLPQAVQEITIIRGEENSVTFVNERSLGEIRVKKEDPSGNALTNVQFLLEYSRDGYAWHPVRFGKQGGTIGICTSTNLVNGCLSTGTSGSVLFSGLRLDCFYRLTEVRTENGKTLLSEPVFQGRLDEQVSDELAITVINSDVFLLPATGCEDINYAALGLPIAAISLCLSVLRCKRRKSQDES